MSAPYGASAIASSHDSASTAVRAAKASRFALRAAVALTGCLWIALVAAAGHLPAGDAVALVAYAAGGAAVAGAVAAGLLGLLRRSSVVAQAAVAGLAPVLAVAIGVAGASSAMFISGHDLHALWLILIASGTVGLLIALLLGGRVAGAGRSLEAMARRLADEGPGARLGAPPGNGSSRMSSSELDSLSAELELTSARLAEAQDQATALERSRRELVAWVSHDLRTPLAGIRAMVEALEDGVVTDPETVVRYHRTMRQEADRLAGLVDDLFELSRIQAGALALDLERVALDDLVSEAVATASIAAAAKGIDVRGAVGEPSPVVELSTPEMARVVRNLLDNAVRHTRPGGTIWIHAGLDESATAAEVSVLDACGGIPESDLDHVFEMAYRGDAARTPGDGGAGLGLALARGLVEAHNGQISVRNEGDGCRFTVWLPLSHPTNGSTR
jgi:signal transduction histidine kinase